MRFSYSVPDDFCNRVKLLLTQVYSNNLAAEAFAACDWEFNDVGLAYYAGIKGDNWDKHAVDLTLSGSIAAITTVKEASTTVEEAVEKALRPASTGLLLRCVDYLADESALPSSNEARLNADMETAGVVLMDLLDVGSRLCNRAMYAHASEDDINDYFRDIMEYKGYVEVKDQTRHGVSLSGKESGEVDILISLNGKEVALFEGLKLSCVDKGYINAHIKKAVVNYNALGTATFVVAYVSSADFGQFWAKYYDYLKDCDFALEQKKALAEETYPSAATRVASTILSRDGFDFPVYFLAIKLCDAKTSGN